VLFMLVLVWAPLFLAFLASLYSLIFYIISDFSKQSALLIFSPASIALSSLTLHFDKSPGISTAPYGLSGSAFYCVAYLLVEFILGSG